MSNTRDDWAQWAASSGVGRRLQNSIDKHRAASFTTAEAYLAQKRVELACELEGKTLIYFDTKHWINLRHVVVQSPQSQPIYNDILSLLEMLRQRSRICCPVSFALFEELMKQNDTTTRRATARIMDFLSGGVCLQNWLDLGKAELGRHVCRTFRIGDLDEAAFPTWTKAGYWAGEHTFAFPESAAGDSGLMEIVYADLRWGMTFEEYQDMPDWIPIPDALAAAWVKEAGQTKARLSNSKRSFAELVRERRLQLLAAVKDEFVPILALCCGVPGKPEEHVAAVFGPIYEGRDSKALPSVEVVASLDAAITLDAARKAQASDMLDYLHAAQALPYCDAVFCDNFMAQKMRNKPLEFGKLFDTEIGSRAEEICAYLKGLT